MNIYDIFPGTVIIFYACSVMYLLLDVNRSMLSPQKKLYGTIYFILFIALNMSAQILLGPSLYGKLYLFISQLPVFFLFLIISRYKGIKLVFVLLTAVFFTSPLMTFLSVLGKFFKPPVTLYLVSAIIMLFIINKYFKQSFHYVLENADNRLFLTFSVIPFLYYVYTFASTKYQYVGLVIDKQYLVRQIPMVIVIFSYVLLTKIFKMIFQQSELKNAQNLASVQLNAATKEIEQLRASERQTAIYRHDLRLHMNYLGACIRENKLSEALDYIKQTYSDIENMKVIQYSQNEPLNLILSSYAAKAKEHDINIKLHITAYNFSKFNITDLCSLLSNALENAIIASDKVDNKDLRYIDLSLFESKSHLCLNLYNGYLTGPIFEDGIPVSHMENHGFGVKSIIRIVEKYKGLYKFSAHEGVFRLQIII